MELPQAVRAIADMNLDDPAEFERQFQAVYAYAARRVGETLGEEIAAETFARALAARAKYDGREDPAPVAARHRQQPAAAPWRSEKRRLNAYARSITHDGDG